MPPLHKRQLPTTAPSHQHNVNIMLALREDLGLHGPEELEAWNKALEEFLSEDITFIPAGTKRRRQRVLSLWPGVLRICDPKFNLENEYTPATIKKYALAFLPTIVHHLKPVNGSPAPSAGNFRRYFDAFVWLILSFCVEEDPSTGEIRRTGQDILRDGLFMKLDDQLKYLTLRHKLVRHAQNKESFGRYELHPILSTMLESSASIGKAPQRAVILQRGVQFLMVFYTTCRPSTLAPGEQIWRELGQFIKLKDVTIVRNGPMNYTVVIESKYYKRNYSTTQGRQQDIHLTSVTKNHNVVFDITLWFLGLLFVRSDFAIKYETLDELLEDNRLNIALDPEKAEYPLFYASKSGGRGFVDEEPPPPSLASAVGDAFNHWAKAAGFVHKLGIYNLRRDASNMYAAKLGMDLARSIMAHKTGETVLQQYYLRSATNTVNLVGVRLGEVRGQNESFAGEADSELEKLTLFKSAALQCLMRRRTAMESVQDEQAGATSGSKRQRNEHDEHPDIVQIDNEIEPRWHAYLACFRWTSTRRTTLKPAQQNVNSLYNGKYDTMTRKSGMDDEIETLYRELRKLFSDRSDLKRKISKNHKRQKKRDERETTFKTAEWTDQDEAQAKLDLVDAMGSIDRAAFPRVTPPVINSSDSTRPAGNIVNTSIIDLQNKLCDEEWATDAGTSAGLSESAPKRWLDAVIDVQRAISAEDELDAQPPPKIMRLLKGRKADTAETSDVDAQMPSKNQSGGTRNPGVDVATAMEEGQARLAEDIENMADVDEEREFDVFGSLSLEDVKRQMLTFFLGPCLAPDGTLVSIRDGKMACDLCTARGAEFSGNYTELRRHKDYRHSEWAELKESLGRDGDSFYCPSCPDQVHENRRHVIAHMLSDCPDEERYTALSEKHEADTAKWHPEPAPLVPKETPALKNRAEDLEMEMMLNKVMKMSLTPRHDNSEAALALGVDPIERDNRYNTFNYDNILQEYSFPRISLPDFTTRHFTDNDCDNVYMVDDL